jgi:small conductance mechanosensitive channel
VHFQVRPDPLAPGAPDPDTAAAEQPQAVYTSPDSVLAARLDAVYGSFEEFDGVTFSVTEGVVRLAGTVDNPDVRRRLEELTNEIQGVVYVVSEVETATDVETRLTPAVAQVQEYWDAFVAQLPVLAVALLVVLLFWGASFMLGRWRRPAAWTGINPLLWSFISRLVRGLMVAVGLLLAFDILGITSLMGAVLGTAGIVGLAIGFAFKDIVENYLAGMLLSLRRPFSVNDLVRVGDFEGRIVRLTSRELVLLTVEGNHVRLPNAHVFKTPLTNFTINPRRLFSSIWASPWTRSSSGRSRWAWEP